MLIQEVKNYGESRLGIVSGFTPEELSAKLQIHHQHNDFLFLVDNQLHCLAHIGNSKTSMKHVWAAYGNVNTLMALFGDDFRSDYHKIRR